MIFSLWNNLKFELFSDEFAHWWIRILLKNVMSWWQLIVPIWHSCTKRSPSMPSRPVSIVSSSSSYQDGHYSNDKTPSSSHSWRLQFSGFFFHYHIPSLQGKNVRIFFSSFFFTSTNKVGEVMFSPICLSVCEQLPDHSFSCGVMKLPGINCYVNMRKWLIFGRSRSWPSKIGSNFASSCHRDVKLGSKFMKSRTRHDLDLDFWPWKVCSRSRFLKHSN